METRSEFLPPCQLLFFHFIRRLTIHLRGRYRVSKLLEVLFVRELVSRLNDKSSKPPVTIDLINPGLCATNIAEGDSLGYQIFILILCWTIASSAEVGSRTLVHGASTGPESHGEYMNDGQNQDVEKWIYEDVGKRAQRKVFEQTMKVLETRMPGVGKAAGLSNLRIALANTMIYRPLLFRFT